MNIIETNLTWKTPFEKRPKTEYIIVHHTAHPNCSIQDIHKWHQDKGWNGVGYHLFIRKDGKIYRGRPLDTVGAQCEGYNHNGIGIALEGNFDVETVSKLQGDVLRQVLIEMVKLYPNAKIVQHKDLYATSCAGKLFDNNLLKINLVDEYQEAIKILVKNGIITTPTYWQSITTTAKADYVKELIKNLAKFISKK